MISVTVLGDQQFASKMARLPECARNRLTEELYDIGSEVATSARSRAPIGRVRSKTSKRYGSIRSKIRARIISKTNSISAVVDLHTAFYGRYVEHGMPWKSARITYHRGKRSTTVATDEINPKTGKMKRVRRRLVRPALTRAAPRYAAQPFMGPAHDEAKPDAESRIHSALTEALRESHRA